MNRRAPFSETREKKARMGKNAGGGKCWEIKKHQNIRIIRHEVSVQILG